MSLRDAGTSRASILPNSDESRIRVLIRARFFVRKTGRARMFSFGKEGAGIWLTTKSRTDTSVFRRKDLSGVGRYRQMLRRFHAEVPIPVRLDGVGEMGSSVTMIADRATASRERSDSFPTIDAPLPVASRRRLGDSRARRRRARADWRWTLAIFTATDRTHACSAALSAATIARRTRPEAHAIRS